MVVPTKNSVRISAGIIIIISLTAIQIISSGMCMDYCVRTGGYSLICVLKAGSRYIKMPFLLLATISVSLRIL